MVDLLSYLRETPMNTYGASSNERGRGEVGIGAAQHVYGPASVHLLPCKIHHTGVLRYEE